VIPGRLDDLSADVSAILRSLPGVVDVQRHGPAHPSHRIVHLLDWHYVSRDDYAADLRSQGEIPNTEVDRNWEDLLTEVAAVQEEQLAIVRRLIEQHGLRQVYIEGLTDRDVPFFRAKVAALREIREELSELRKLVKESGSIPLEEELKAIEERFRRDLLQVGAAGRLLMEGKVEVLPLDDADAYDAANPVKNGSVVLDERRIEARQDAQVKRLLRGNFALVILGSAHDLADNLDRLSGGKAEYIRVATKRWREYTKILEWRESSTRSIRPDRAG